MKGKRELQLWKTASLAHIPHSFLNLLLSHVTLQLLPLKGHGLLLWYLWFSPYGLLHLKEWSRNGLVPVLNLSPKKSCRFPLALRCLCHCHEKSFPGQLIPIQPGPTSWLTDLKKRANLPQPICRSLQISDYYFKPQFWGNLLFSIIVTIAIPYSNQFSNTVFSEEVP